MVTTANDDIGLVLSRARGVVAENWRRRAEQGHVADEELQTNWLCDAAWPRIEYAQFNRRQEASVGADWLWWFVDGNECFGVLLQAKRIRGDAGARTLDFAYPRSTGRQMQDLLDASDALGVAAGYILYFSPVGHRSDLTCRDHAASDCELCDRLCVAALPALAAQTAVRLNALSSAHEVVLDAFRLAVPLEDLVTRNDDPVRDLNVGIVSAELRELLLEPQDGPREVAKTLFRVVADIRFGQMSAAVQDRRRTDASAVFDELPADAGHFGRHYYDDVFRGLRTGPPDYLASFLAGDASGLGLLPENIGGLIVVHM